MSKKRDKVKCKTELEFVIEVADDCISHLKDKDREYIINNPCAIDYHFSYCLYIRNHYIHNRDFSDATFWSEPDHLSSAIIRMIFSKLLPEYEYDNFFIEELYNDERFIKLRQEYKGIYDEYPVDLVEEYKKSISLEPAMLMSEVYNSDNVDLDKEMEIYERNHEKCREHIEQLVKELAEKVWRIDSLRKTAEKYDIDFDMLVPRIEEIKQILFEDEEFIPMEVCLLPYKKEIGQDCYVKYRKSLIKQLDNSPRLMEKLDASYFNDRVLAKAVLKYGWPLELLTQYQDDDVMVKYSISHNGEAIQYASKRFQTDREWVKFAIEHSEDGTIMYLECMKPYRLDKELVYLACKVSRWNYIYVDKSFRDDYELAKICMEQIGDPNSIYSYMSARLRGNKELAMLDLQEDFPNIEYYSSKLRNDDEIGAELFRIHGASSWEWYYMSKRIKKKYKIEED